MNQNTNQERTPEQQKISPTVQTTPSLTNEELKKFSMLRIKADPEFKKTLRSLSLVAREDLEQRYNAQYNQQFGQLEISPDELNELKTLERKNSRIYQKKIEKFNYELGRALPEENFEGFPHINDPIAQEDSSLPTLERVRIALTAMPEELKVLFQEYFSVRFTNTDWDNRNNSQARDNNQLLEDASGGAMIEKYLEGSKQKYRIIVDKSSCYEEETRYYGGKPLKVTYFNLEKLSYLIIRAILSTIRGKDEFEDFLKEKKYSKNIDKNCPNKVDDWLALCFSNSDLAKNFGKDKELYNKAIEWLKKAFKEDKLKPEDPETQIIKSRQIDEKILKEKTRKFKDPQTGEEVHDFWQAVLATTNKYNVGWLGKALYISYSLIPKPQFDFDEYYFALADQDQKEVKKLMSLEKTGGDYIKMLKTPKYYHDKEKMRQLLLVIAQKGAYQSWMAHLWLRKHDWKYKHTKGKEITQDAFDFITRLTKDAGKGLKAPLRADYKRTPQGKYVRQSYEAQVATLDVIFNQMSLREIQRISADAYGNNWDDDNKKFIDIDAKLKIGKEGKVYVNSLDGDLSSLIGKNEAKQFVEDMKLYSKEIGEEKLLNLSNPLVTVLTRRYLQASRTEPMLFNMYTAPLIKQGFEAYKNEVGEPQYSIDEYKKDFEKQEKKLEDNDYDIEKTVENSDFSALNEIFKDYTKEKREMPYVRGLQTTKYGKINEFVSQAKEKVLEIDLPQEVHKYISSAINKISQQDIISTEDIDKLHRDIKDKTENLDRDKKLKLGKELDNFFERLSGLGVVKQYQAIFKPYEYHLRNYLATKEEELPKNEKTEFRNWYYQELLPAQNQTAEEKLENIERKYPEMSLGEKQKQILSQKPREDEKISYLSDIISKKLKYRPQEGKIRFMSDYNSLNSLWFDVNRAIKYPDQYKGNLDDFITEFQKLDLVPEKDKSEPIIDYRQLANYLKLAKIVADDYYEQEERRKQARYSRGLLGYLPGIEEELEEEEEAV